MQKNRIVCTTTQWQIRKMINKENYKWQKLLMAKLTNVENDNRLKWQMTKMTKWQKWYMTKMQM